MTVVLIGFMGSGKTTVGRALAERLGKPFVDTDVLVEQVAGRTIDEIWSDEGEEGFRDREERALQQACAADAVIATGGGVVLRAVNRALLGTVDLVAYLRTPLELAWTRAAGAKGRPNAQDRERFDALHAERLPLYEETATTTVDASQTVEQIVDLLAKGIDG